VDESEEAVAESEEAKTCDTATSENFSRLDRDAASGLPAHNQKFFKSKVVNYHSEYFWSKKYRDITW
jgi:hypothetical protein